MAFIGIGGRSVPAARYMAGIRAAKENPEARFARTLHSWAPGTGADVMAEYRRDLHKRINERGGIVPHRSRVHPCTWGRASMPRVVLERHDVQSMNRSAKKRLANRMRDFD